MGLHTEQDGTVHRRDSCGAAFKFVRNKAADIFYVKILSKMVPPCEAAEKSTDREQVTGSHYLLLGVFTVSRVDFTPTAHSAC